MKLSEQELNAAHAFSNFNKDDLMKSNVCGCFSCLAIFDPKLIVSWEDSGIAPTAWCPHCGVDSIIAEKSGFPITPVFLMSMCAYYFDEDLAIRQAKQKGYTETVEFCVKQDEPQSILTSAEIEEISKEFEALMNDKST